MPVCPFCKVENPTDTKHCHNCGSSLQAPQRAVCRRCGSAIRSGDAFCSKCGEPIERGEAVKSHELGAPESNRRFTPPLQPPPDNFPEELTATTPPLRKQSAPSERTRRKISTKTQLLPTQEVIRMAHAIGVDIDYNTLRFWQKRGLVPKPIRGPVDNGRGTRGYYDATLVDRIAFIRSVQKTHSMGLDAIREELERIDLLISQGTNGQSAGLYHERLLELQSQRDVESKRTLLVLLSKSLGIDAEEIATIVVRKKDGQTIRFLPGRMLNDVDQ